MNAPIVQPKAGAGGWNMPASSLPDRGTSRFKIGDRWVTMHVVTMPARPFFPVANDKLTAKAEEKIRAAGERAAWLTWLPGSGRG